MFHYVIFCFCFIIVLCDKLDKFQGSSCSWEGLSGTCASVYNCRSTLLDIKEKKFPPICSYKGTEPIICCTDCTLVNDTRLFIIDKNLGFLEKNGEKAHDECLNYINKLDYPIKRGRISTITMYTAISCRVDGVDVKFSDDADQKTSHDPEFPYLALLGSGESWEKATWPCGGAIISEQFILTAAHCFGDAKQGTNIKYVAVGLVNRADSSKWKQYGVSKVIPHPEYKSPSKYHDIGLVQTDKQIVFDRVVRPACFHKLSSENGALLPYWGFERVQNSQALSFQNFVPNLLISGQNDPSSVPSPGHPPPLPGYPISSPGQPPPSQPDQKYPPGQPPPSPSQSLPPPPSSQKYPSPGPPSGYPISSPGYPPPQANEKYPPGQPPPSSGQSYTVSLSGQNYPSQNLTPGFVLSSPSHPQLVPQQSNEKYPPGHPPPFPGQSYPSLGSPPSYPMSSPSHRPPPPQQSNDKYPPGHLSLYPGQSYPASQTYPSPGSPPSYPIGSPGHPPPAPSQSSETYPPGHPSPYPGQRYPSPGAPPNSFPGNPPPLSDEKYPPGRPPPFPGQKYPPLSSGQFSAFSGPPPGYTSSFVVATSISPGLLSLPPFVIPGDYNNTQGENRSEVLQYNTETYKVFKPQDFYPPQQGLTSGYNHTIQMSYEIENNKNCKGIIDGAPLLKPLREARCAYIITGVTSIPMVCGDKRNIGLFTRVLYYQSWLESIVWP